MCCIVLLDGGVRELGVFGVSLTNKHTVVSIYKEIFKRACRGSTPANPMVRDPGLVMRGTGWTIARRQTGRHAPARYYWWGEMRLQWMPRLERSRLGLQMILVL